MKLGKPGSVSRWGARWSRSTTADLLLLPLILGIQVPRPLWLLLCVMNRRAFHQLNGLLARFVSKSKLIWNRLSWASGVHSVPFISPSASDFIWPLKWLIIRLRLPMIVDFMANSLSNLLALLMTWLIEIVFKLREAILLAWPHCFDCIYLKLLWLFSTHMLHILPILGDHYIWRIILYLASSASILSQIHKHIMIWTYWSMSLPCLLFQAALHVVFNSGYVLLVVQCLGSVLSDCYFCCFILSLSPLSG